MAKFTKRGGREPENPPPDQSEAPRDGVYEPPQHVSTAMVQREVSDMVQVAMAHPRDLGKVMESAMEELDQLEKYCPELAEKGWYSIEFKKHSGGEGCTRKANDSCPVESTAEGLSVKSSYALLGHYTNLASKSYVAEETDTKIRIVGVCRDLQRNNVVERDFTVSKIITYRGGGSRTLYDSELVKAEGAGCSKAIRNSILNSIEQWIKAAYWKRLRQIDDDYQTKKAGGKEEAKKSLVAEFEKRGVTKDMIKAKFGVDDLRKVSDEQRMMLRGWFNAIETGEATVDSIFGTPDSPPTQATDTTTATATSEEVGTKRPAAPAEPQRPEPQPTGNADGSLF